MRGPRFLLPSLFGAATLIAVPPLAHGAEARPDRRPLEPTPVEIRRTTVGTFIGLDDDLVIAHLREAEIAEAKLNKGGSSISFRLTFRDGTRAAFKPLQRNPQTTPRKEVAAYRLGRLLGLNHIAPATMRALSRELLLAKLHKETPAAAIERIHEETIFDERGDTRGELSYWIPVIVDSHLDTVAGVLAWWKALTVGQPLPREKQGLLAQLSTLLLFDLLQNNSDRFSGGNLMTSADGRFLYFMDNAFGFQPEDNGHLKCRTYLARCQKFSRSFVERLRRLDEAELRQALAAEEGLLDEEELRSLLKRRDFALRYVDGLLARFGERQVLVFP